MAQNYGTLEKRIVQKDKGPNLTVFMGLLAVPNVLTAQVAIAPKASVVGNEWPLEVKAKQDGGVWATLGSAKFERKNPQANWYLRIVLESPKIDRDLGGALWLRAFPQSDDKGDKPKGADSYDMIWGNGGGKAKAETPELDDEIPF